MMPVICARPAIWLAVAGLAIVTPNSPAGAQAPKEPDKTLPPPRLMAPGYNPGEMLRDLANPVVAEVDGHPITLAEVGDAIRALPATMRQLPFEDLYPGVLERLIQQQALVSRARGMRLDIDPVVKRRMQAAADRVLENELLNRVLDAQVSEQALLARYQKDYGDKAGVEEVKVRVILVPTEQQARKLIGELQQGADFEALAQRDSKDASAGQGGELGFLRQDQLLPEVGAAAFVLEPGSITPNPIRASGGWFIVKAEMRRRVPPPPYAELRERLRQQVIQEGLAEVARDAVAQASVRRFNMNGTNPEFEEEQAKAAARGR